MNIIQTSSFQIAVHAFGDPSASRIALLLPGRLDTKDYVNFTKHGEFLANLGFFAIAIDPPFTWESPGNIAHYTTTNYVNAVHELIEHFGNRPTLLLGHSRGGATSMLASNNPAVVGIAVINAAYSAPSAADPTKIHNGTLREARDLPPGTMRTEEKIKFNLPLNYFEDGKLHDPASALLRYAGPKLVVHATRDEFKTFDSVREIYQQLNGPKMFLSIDCTHDYRLFPEAIEEVNAALGSFIATYLKKNE
ncbi:alpha/beta fold hydrolase [Candidatus Saccharibacteria bacterium]|nr:alpha/beta fold hydrolase [Candidatus Saccharibacteria bacterium]